ILMTLPIFFLLLDKGFVASAELIVRNIRVDFVFAQIMIIGFVRETCVGGNDGSFFIDIVADAETCIAIFDRGQNRLQRMVFLAFAESLGIHTNLVLLIDSRHTVVTLNGAFAGRHLGRLVVGDITLYFLWPLSLPHPWGCCL